MYVGACADEARGQHLAPSSTVLYFLRQHLSLNLGLAYEVNLADQEVSRILALPFNLWDYMHALLCLEFFHVHSMC